MDVVEATPNTLSPAALPIASAARLLSTASRQLVPAEEIELDIASGAPVNSDGTLNLVHYAAWLVKELAGRDR